MQSKRNYTKIKEKLHVRKYLYQLYICVLFVAIEKHAFYYYDVHPVFVLYDLIYKLLYLAESGYVDTSVRKNQSICRFQ